MYHIDKRGIIRYLRVGEGGCQQTEQQIRVKNPPGREQVAIRLAGTSFPQTGSLIVTRSFVIGTA